MAACIPSGVTATRSASVTVMTLLSRTVTFTCLEGRSAYMFPHSVSPHPLARSTASTTSIPDSASPTAGLMASVIALSSRSAATASVECSAEPTGAPSAPASRRSIAASRRSIVASENTAVPWPFASKYTPTSNVSATGCKNLTPVLAHAHSTPRTSRTYAVDAPLAYAVCTTPTRRGGSNALTGAHRSSRSVTLVATSAAILSPSRSSAEPSLSSFFKRKYTSLSASPSTLTQRRDGPNVSNPPCAGVRFSFCTKSAPTCSFSDPGSPATLRRSIDKTFREVGPPMASARAASFAAPTPLAQSTTMDRRSSSFADEGPGTPATM
mmetsp:Transcript_8596/g.37903  ORF Transcript_8596/g.37903 Transcript_8596/m.37903 type:complete len:325 (-) Transcript_8596:635-1609(-)